MAQTSGFVFVALCGLLAVFIVPAIAVSKIVCYYDSRTLEREGAGKIEPIDLEPALPLCTHLVYGYAVIDGNNNQLTPRDVYIDDDAHKGYYKKITSLKARHPGLRVILSVGGGADIAGEKTKYLTLLETPESRAAFVQSARTLLKKYNFDGLDLAWQFPQIKEKKDRGAFGNIWHKVKKTFSGSTKDDKEEEHRDGFTALVRELRAALRGDGFLLSLGILPHVNSTVYYDYRVIAPLVDQIHLMSTDFHVPDRSPQEADYAAPLFYVHDRKSYQNVDSFVRRWLENGVDAFKLVVGVPTYGRTWALTSESAISGVPPLVADGPGEQGTVTKTPGLLAWQETCLMLKTGDRARDGLERILRKVTDPSKRLGSYGFKAHTSDSPGIWVSYEEPDTAAYKAAYVKSKQLGGVAVLDLSLDDPRGVCGNNAYPILTAIKTAL